jgi:hypothetical protein
MRKHILFIGVKLKCVYMRKHTLFIETKKVTPPKSKMCFPYENIFYFFIIQLFQKF